MFDVAGLRVMRAIAEQGSFTAAANSLGYTQPAISQMVRRLEQRTGTALVERSGRTVRLTEAGSLLADRATDILDRIEKAQAEVSAIAGLQAGRVRLMAFPSSSATLVPRALAGLRASHPAVTVQFSEAEPPESLAALRSGDVDLAVAFSYEGNDPGRGVDDLSGLDVFDVLTDPVMLVLPKDHELAAQDAVELADLEAEQWIAGCPRCRGHLLTLAHKAGFDPEVAFETEDYVAVLGLVAAGLGVALVPHLILTTVSHPDVVVRPVVPPSRRVVQVITTPDLRRVPAVAAALEALSSSAAELRANACDHQACEETEEGQAS
ncbi:LysR family transcriptional regulator [Ornithinimicrobium sufpigmenti]|uniref:LysR family transcriptional regulator n=1 Tax=Ornithinimicrobium sufpigmenti TaxID=2508882 RepID=UPI0010359463|nr:MULTISPECIES: LysR family transcriptional regulator [unclassified Ornithinimicrobium]